MENGEGDCDRKKTCLVLGGRGFIGRVLVERLLSLGNWIVRVANSTQSPELEPFESLLSQALSSGAASYFQVDVRNKPQITNAMEGVSVVFYTESMTSFPEDFYSCYTIIVQGAKNVIKACEECKVKHLIYNSSADVVFDSSRNICNGDESLPYPNQFENMVTDLRSQAEALMLFANKVDGLLTCVLRPCNVFGPGDNQFMQSLANIVNSNWTKFIIGSSGNMVEFTYVDNVAHAHICAEESLSSPTLSASGKVFFITNHEPMKVRDFMPLLLETLGHQRNFVIPSWFMHYFILLVKLMHMKLNSGKMERCMVIYDVAKLVPCTRTFSCFAAKTHLGYLPIVSMKEGAALSAESFCDLAQDLAFMSYNGTVEQSKVHKLLGSGKVADILLWRDEKMTFSCFLFLSLLYYWFFFTGKMFITSAAELMMMIVVSLRGYFMLPANHWPISAFFICSGFGALVYNYFPYNLHHSVIPRLSSTSFEVSKINMRDLFLAMACMWNKLSLATRSLAQGEDWHTFFKVSSFLYFCKLIIPRFMTVAIGVALALAFTLFFIYDQYEGEINEMVLVAVKNMREAAICFVRTLPVALKSVIPDRERLQDKKFF